MDNTSPKSHSTEETAQNQKLNTLPPTDNESQSNTNEDQLDNSSFGVHKPITTRSPLNKGGRPRVNSVAMAESILDLTKPSPDDNQADPSPKQAMDLSTELTMDYRPTESNKPKTDAPLPKAKPEAINSPKSDLPLDIGFINTSIMDTVSSDDNPVVNIDETGDTILKKSPMPSLDNPPPKLSKADPVARALNELEQTKTRIGLDVANAALKKGYRILDKYEIIDVIGSGGFATVYRALRLSDKQELAIKVMDIKKCGDPKVSKRFLREAEIAAEIHHPNVTSAYDFGYMEDTGQPFITMELLKGHDLTTELKKNGPLSPKRAFTLFRPVVEALAEGHKIGVVHKDLKPDNFFIVDPGTPNECMKILDYGIAYLKNEAMRLTSDGQLVGTPRYLAPEYIHSRDVSPAVDVYQIALIISEALSRVPAIAGEAFQAMMHHCSGNLSVSNFLLIGKVGEVFSKAWALEPENRYQNCTEFGKALDSIKNNFLNNSQTNTGVTQIISTNFKPVPDNLPAPTSLPSTTPPPPPALMPNSNAVMNNQDKQKALKKKHRKIIIAILAAVLCAVSFTMWYVLTMDIQPASNNNTNAPATVDVNVLCDMASKAFQKGNFCEAVDLYQLANEKGIHDNTCKQDADLILKKYASRCDD